MIRFSSTRGNQNDKGESTYNNPEFNAYDSTARRGSIYNDIDEYAVIPGNADNAGDYTPLQSVTESNVDSATPVDAPEPPPMRPDIYLEIIG